MNKLSFYIILLAILAMDLSANISSNFIAVEDIDTEGENFTLWIALFGLGAVGLIGLFLSSEKLRNFEDKTKKKEDVKSKMDQKQDQILSDMGENIQNIAKNTVQKAKDISDGDADMKQELEKVVESEIKLLSITTNLIEFLRIKSKKVSISNDLFKISNLFHDISGTIISSAKDKDVELIYNIDNNIPENIIGDTLHLSKVLVNLLMFSLDGDSKEIEVTVSKNTMFNKNETLYFTVLTGVVIDVEKDDNLFNSNYNEDTSSYESLGLFIAKELSALMGGELIARNDKHGAVEFLFDIPFKVQKVQEPKNLLEPKKILLVDSSDKSANAIKEMLVSLKHKVEVKVKKDFILNLPNFSNYEVAIIDEKLFSNELLQKLQNTGCKVITLSNVFLESTNSLKDRVLNVKQNKPLVKIDIAETLDKLFQKQVQKQEVSKVTKIDESTLSVHKQIFKDAQNITLYSFAKFRGTDVLLVEDDLINQKVLVGVLGRSNMKITIANNGQEALEIIEQKDGVFDVVLMDINMPIMDGYTASVKIRENSIYKNTPIIAISALTATSEVEKMFSSGMNGYLSKPLKKEKLYTAFELFLTQKVQDKMLEAQAKIEEKEKVQALDGLNIALGISQSNANEIFYKEILYEFKDAYSTSDKVFKKLVDDFRFEQLKMLCVDMRGLAGSIGAEDLHALTHEVLQHIIFKKQDLIVSCIDRYREELDRVNRSIDQYLK